MKIITRDNYEYDPHKEIYPNYRNWKDGQDKRINVIPNPLNRFDQYDRCRVFFSYTDLHIFAAECPNADIPDMTFILNRMENLPKLRKLIESYKNVSYCQYKILRRSRMRWARKYTSGNLDDFFEDFIHDRNVLEEWEDSAIIPEEMGPDGSKRDKPAKKDDKEDNQEEMPSELE